MKVVIASDIHGSIKYLTKLVDIIKKEKPEKVVLLGDYFNYYLEYDEEIVNLLNSIPNLIAIKGNCDKRVDDKLDFKLHNYYLLEVDDLELFLTHQKDEYDYLIDDNYIILCGHTHVYNLKNKHINPGSIGFPRIHKEHTYIIYEDNKFSLYDINTLNMIKLMTVKGVK